MRFGIDRRDRKLYLGDESHLVEGVKVHNMGRYHFHEWRFQDGQKNNAMSVGVFDLRPYDNTRLVKVGAEGLEIVTRGNMTILAQQTDGQTVRLDMDKIYPQSNTPFVYEAGTILVYFSGSRGVESLSLNWPPLKDDMEQVMDLGSTEISDKFRQEYKKLVSDRAF